MRQISGFQGLEKGQEISSWGIKFQGSEKNSYNSITVNAQRMNPDKNCRLGL